MKGTKEMNNRKNAKANGNHTSHIPPHTSQNGITLIALIITIIVMLILVAVTINMAVNGGLFGYAGKATGETQNAIDKEQSIADGAIKIGDVYYTIGDYIEQVTENNDSRLKLTYTVTPAEDNLSAVITVNARMLGGLLEGYEEYRTWALKKLEGKTEEQIEQIFVDGLNYWNIEDEQGHPFFSNVKDWVEYCVENWPDYYTGCEDIYDVVELEGYETLSDMAIDWSNVYPKEYEFWDYFDYFAWARKQLQGKTDEEIEMIFVDGQNYWNEVNDYGEPMYANIDELVEYWLENFPDDYPGCENIYDMVELVGYDTLADMAIDWSNVYPEKWAEQEGKLYDNIIHIMDPSGEIWWETNTVEYTVYGDGEYTFIATNETGTESNSVTVKIDMFGYLAGHDGERFSYTYEKTKSYTDVNRDTAVIPKGFSVGISEGIDTIDTGLVICDVNGNEFVWIPVEKAIVTEAEIATIKAKDSKVTTDVAAVQSLVDSGIYPMAVQVGTDYKGILYDFTHNENNTLTLKVMDWNTSDYMEPFNLTEEKTFSAGTTVNGTTIEKETKYKYDSQEMFDLYGGGTYSDSLYQKSYNNMVISVDKNGGFYVGRYEISNDDGLEYVESKKGKRALSDTWYKIYKLEKAYAEKNINLGVKSEMIWGSQWDQIMIFVNGKNDGTINQVPFYVAKTGDRRTGSYPADTGMNPNGDEVANIFDLEAGLEEIMQEGYRKTYSHRRNQ